MKREKITRDLHERVIDQVFNNEVFVSIATGAQENVSIELTFRLFRRVRSAAVERVRSQAKQIL